MLCRVSPLLALVSFNAVLCLNPTPGNAAIVLLDFEDLRTANAEPVNVVRAGYDQQLLEGGALANFRETVIARGAAGLRLDRLLSPL